MPDPLKLLADLLVYRWLGLRAGTHLADALNFFLYDVPKILVLLTAIIFVVSIIRSFFPPEKTRRFLGRKRSWLGNVLAALLGIVTPFCSCSAVPLFIGLVESGVPLGVTLSFLISSPAVNEVALVMLLGLFGWKIAALYVASGVSIAIVAGIILGRLRLERYVEDYVYQMKLGSVEVEKPPFRQRVVDAWAYTREILRKVSPWVVAGVGAGALIHGYVPVGWLARVAGRGNPLAVPIAVFIGVPLYSNAAGTIPIVQALVAKGVPIGTALALMMAVTALSLPEAIILRKVMKPRLLAVYFGVVALAIVFVGYLFNAVIR
jgi:uncharacterized membrane protein YraQ (UPF0718 family)